MSIDFHAKSQQLLERLANSIYDREKDLSKPFFFRGSDLSTAENWLKKFAMEVARECRA